MEKSVLKFFEDKNVAIELVVDKDLENVYWVKIQKPFVKSQLFTDINQAELHFRHLVSHFL